jgi:VWFA-related protein
MRSLHSLVVLAVALALASDALAQSGAPEPPASQAPADGDDRVVQLSVELVQVDAVVTDKKGRRVTDLKPEDFEVLEDGSPQNITYFSYVAETASAPPPRTPALAPGASPAPGPSTRLRQDQVRRTIVLVVDATGFENVHFAREAMRKFVNEQMQPGDLVSIVQARLGAHSVQTFTSDKRELLGAIERVKWSPRFASIDNSLDRDSNADCDDTSPKARGGPARAGGGASAAPLDFGDGAALRGESFTRGSLGVVYTVARSLEDLPGRKAIVLLSEGYPYELGKCNNRVEKAMNALVDTVNRAGVAIYTVDIRGLVVTMPGADVSTADAGAVVATRHRNLFRSQDILSTLALKSGGTFVHNTNDIAGAIRRAADDQNGYYLIGYEPGESTFSKADNGRAFHKLSVRVKRPDLVVRSRTGFYGMTDDEVRVAPRAPGARLLQAAMSPFGADGVHLSLAPVFADDEQTGPHVTCLLHFDARDLSFVEGPNGTRTVKVELLVLLLDEYGAPATLHAVPYTIEVDAKTYESVLRNGIDYTMVIPATRAGHFQVRSVVRDTASDRVGATFQPIDVPNLKKGRLAVSDISLGTGEGVNVADTAVRRFRRGGTMIYTFQVYNARHDQKARRPQLEFTARLYREGEAVYTGLPQPLDFPEQPDLARIRAGRVLQLGAEMQPGVYVLEVTVVDTLSNKKHGAATQWIDFEVVP